MRRRVRVVVVDDSATVRKHLVGILNAYPDFEVVGEAADGRTAIELCERLRPDVMTLDMALPLLSGLAVTEHVMAFCPTPILIVSASTNRTNLFDTYDALAAGAVDVLDKPRTEDPRGRWQRRFVAAVRMVSRIKVIVHPRARLGRFGERKPTASVRVAPGPWHPRALAIGASTGGPKAVLEVLKSLPTDFPLPVLVVIHIGETFGEALADWLDEQVDFEVRPAVDGEPLGPVGQCLVRVAPPGRHLQMSKGRLRLVDHPERHACRPSVDVLFESIAAELGRTAIACLLTGMGRDGAAGLRTVLEAGGETIAQDQSTSVIFGMPGEAVRLGAARHVLPLDQIGATIERLARVGQERETS